MPYFTDHGDEIYYRIIGSGSTTVVLTSGGLAPLTTMLPLADQLSSRFRVLLWDRANQGLSSICVHGESELTMVADQLAALLSHLSIGRAILAGASEGSRVSLRTALRHPDSVSGLFLWQLSAGPVMEHVGRLYHLDHAELVRRGGMNALLQTEWARDRIKWNPRNYDRILALDEGEFVHTKERWAAELSANDPVPGHTAAQISSIQTPARIISGVDAAHPRSFSANLARLLPRGEFVESAYDETHFMSVKRAGTVFYASLPGLAKQLDEFAAELESVTADAGTQHKWRTTT